MDIVPSQFLDVHVLWASHHRWFAGQSYSSPSDYPGLWLMLQGEVTVQGRDIDCTLAPGDGLFWNNGERTISTPSGGEWLSVGLQATLVGRTDMMRLLHAPRHWTPDNAAHDMMHSWMRQLVHERHHPMSGIITVVNAA